jgi:hypothetical protein
LADKEKPAPQAPEKAPSPSETPSTTAHDNESLLDPAISNLNTARQFIDPALFPFEEKLISFYCGFAVLTRHRDDPAQRAVAKRYFAESADWKEDEAVAQQHELHKQARHNSIEHKQIPSEEEVRQAIKRIKLESFYNLGVLHHLDKEYQEAIGNYHAAADEAHGSGDDFRGVELLSRFGLLSAIIDDSWMPSLREFAAHRLQLFQQDKERLRKSLTELQTDMKRAIKEHPRVPLTTADSLKVNSHHGPRGLSTECFVLEAMIRRLDRYVKTCFSEPLPD